MQPGDFGLVHMPGPFGKFVEFGQLMTGDSSIFTHAFVVVDNGNIVEARPSGAVEVNGRIYDGYRVVYSDKYGVTLTEEDRQNIVSAAMSLIGTKYSWLDYAAIALHTFHLPSRRVAKYVASTKHMICSQLVDECYRRAGVHLFDDGRLPQDVTPGDLANLLLR